MSNTFTHKHQGIPEHSPEQAAKFFAEAHDLGFNASEVKNRAVKYFKTDCFNKIKSSQLSELIEKLVQTHLDRSQKI